MELVAASALAVGAVALPGGLSSVNAAPCAGAPCAAADPWAAADPCARADVVPAFAPPHSEVYIETTDDLAVCGADPVAYFNLSSGQLPIGTC